MRIAVIGAGVAGLSAAWLLSQAHEVAIHEKNTRLGGHAHTVDVSTKYGTVPVDTGFIVYNDKNYPNLIALFSLLNVKTKNSDMSFAASMRGGELEYNGTDLNGLFGQRRNLMRPRFWRMIFDLQRFCRQAPEFLHSGSNRLSLGEYLSMNGYGNAFCHDHILPMGAAIWSAKIKEVTEIPAKAFIRFFANHGLLSLNDRPQWKTVDGGSREYVACIRRACNAKIEFNADIQAIERRPDQVIVRDCRNGDQTYDHVVLATHADQALALLGDADKLERRTLGAFKYSRNRVVLHEDSRLMPIRKRVWASWNIIDCNQADSQNRLCVTYWMNKLQSLVTEEPLFVTLNPVFEPDTTMIRQEFIYHHPLFNHAVMEAQTDLRELQGRRRTWFCGSYFGYGFHEDGIQAGLGVAEELGNVHRPWHVEGQSDRHHLPGEARFQTLEDAA